MFVLGNRDGTSCRRVPAGGGCSPPLSADHLPSAGRLHFVVHIFVSVLPLSKYRPLSSLTGRNITFPAASVKRWLVIRAFAVRVFTYSRSFYFSVMRNINILSAAKTEAAAQAQWVARAVSPTRPTILTPGTTNEGFSW
jgi:hypothetical protein